MNCLQEEQGNPQPAHGKEEQKRLCRLHGPGAHAVLLHHHGLCRQ